MPLLLRRGEGNYSGTARRRNERIRIMSLGRVLVYLVYPLAMLGACIYALVHTHTGL